MIGIYKIDWYCYHGEITGLFLAEANDVKNLEGMTANFGEVLGKHSEVSWDIDPGDIKLISEDPKDVEVFQRLKLDIGYNPFNYIICPYCGANSKYEECEEECERER